MEIFIEENKNSKIENIDFSNLDFGSVFTDHMFECDFENGEWKQPKIKPYQPLTLMPSAKVFHYGQTVFEGMKSYKDEEDKIWLFRPIENIKRLNKSAERLAMPAFPEEVFLKGLEALLKLENKWIRKEEGSSLYIRPTMIATENAIMASASDNYKFFIICAPVKQYYSGGELKILFEEKYSRAADGGVGFAKAGGNYAASFYPAKLAREKGFQQILWTDAATHTYLEEAGTMNVFFRINDDLYTAPVSDRILDGITRKSLIQLAKDKQINIIEKPITIQEIVEASQKGSLKEVFGAGTAAVISIVTAFTYREEHFELPSNLEDSYAVSLKEQLTSIQQNKIEDKHGWRHQVI